MARSRRTALVALALAAILVGASALPVRAQGGDARAERERVRGERAALAVQIDALEANDASLDRALRDLDENLRGQQALLADAERAAAEATRVASEARAAAAARAVELDALRAEMTTVAVDAYVNPPGDAALDRLKADTATDAAQKHALLSVRAGRVTDLVDQLRATRFALEQERDRAEVAGRAAEEAGRAAQTQLIELQQARVMQAQFADQLEARLNAKLAEAGALAGADARLSATIAAEQAALATQLRALAPPRGGGASGGTDPSPRPPPSVAPVPLTTVRGITVHRSIAGALDGLLVAASADGLTLGGTGYRDPSQQVALRRAHCGPSYYEIYEMPPFLCAPPTAIPGSSLHEQGLAIDFTWNRRSITTQDNAAFVWLAANAARFGFYNLPSEPWHWSVSGK